MKDKTYEQRMEILLDMIAKARMQSQAQAAKQLSCSSRTIRRMIADLKEAKHDIRYSTALKKFYIKK